MKPLAIDLYCGLGGWTEGLLAEGYNVVGFDIERHVYGDHSYPAQLVLQDALTLHGSQFKTAALIVASPPCQEFSYMAMPWTKAKQKIWDYESGVRDVKQLTALFDACFRIQREAIEAAGHHIPLVVENVRGAQRWVGRSRWNFGSFHLWGDVPALMPIARVKLNVYGAFAGQAVCEPARGVDVGGASRFFYVAKPDRAERDRGCLHLTPRQRDESRKAGNPGGDNPRNRGLQPRGNFHPTVKPLDLMRWLVRLVTPNGGTVLDPFTGSGTTGMACVYEGVSCIGIEREAAYVELAQARIADCLPLLSEANALG